MNDEDIYNEQIADLDEFWVEIMPYGKDFIEETKADDESYHIDEINRLTNLSRTDRIRT